MNGGSIAVETPTLLDNLQNVIGELGERVSTLGTSITDNHERLYGPYNPPPTDECEASVETPGRINALTREVQRILEVIVDIREVAESIEQKS